MTALPDYSMHRPQSSAKDCVQPDVLEFFKRHNTSLEWGNNTTTHTYQLHIHFHSDELEILSSATHLIRRVINENGGFCLQYGSSLTGYRSRFTGYFDNGVEAPIRTVSELVNKLPSDLNCHFSSSYGGTRVYLQQNAADYLMIHNLEEKKLRKLSVFSESAHAAYVFTEAMYDQMKDNPDLKEHYRFVGLLDMGLVHPVKVYEYFGCQFSKCAIQKQQTKEVFEAALQAFLDRKYYEAERMFQKCYSINPEDRVAQQYINACQQAPFRPESERLFLQEDMAD